jgi:hypothetical protein
MNSESHCNIRCNILIIPGTVRNHCGGERVIIIIIIIIIIIFIAYFT